MLLDSIFICVPFFFLCEAAKKTSNGTLHTMFFPSNKEMLRPGINWSLSLALLVAFHSSYTRLNQSQEPWNLFQGDSYLTCFFILTVLVLEFGVQASTKQAPQKCPVDASSSSSSSSCTQHYSRYEDFVNSSWVLTPLLFLSAAFLVTCTQVPLIRLALYIPQIPHIQLAVALCFFLLGVLVHSWYSARKAQDAADADLEKAQNQKYDKMRAATYPAPYPNGWYKLCDSKDLPRGELKEIRALDLVLAVFRQDTAEGLVSVLDAYCPHLGANFTKGGVVKGDCVECPFHRWLFDVNGEVKQIPYTDKIPAVKAKKYPSKEFHGMVVFYYDADGAEPAYEPDMVPDISDGKMVYRGSWNSPHVRMHIQEFAENSVDFQHFQPLHGQMKLPFTQVPIPGLTIQHSAQWVPPPKDSDRKHIVIFKDSAYVKFLGRRIPNSDGAAAATFVGPASIVYFRFFLRELGDILLIQTHLPLGPVLQQTQFRWFADPKIPRFLVWYVVGNWISQWHMDILVWENKRFWVKPGLASGDGPVSQLRRWFKQFYSENMTRPLMEESMSW